MLMPRKLTPGDLEKIDVMPLEEDSHWTDRHHAYDPEVQTSFAEMVEKHGLWGWCCVKVTVSWHGLTETAYLGCCSYSGLVAFVECDYYKQLVTEACEHLNLLVEETLLAASSMKAELALHPDDVHKRRKNYGNLTWAKRQRAFCPHCKSDLRDHEAGIPFMRTVGVGVRWRCPDCEGEWQR